jgi:hypothetical protein
MEILKIKLNYQKMFKRELFNKAKIFKKENSNLTKLYKNLYMKKSKTNLKIRVINTNTLSNLSNKYLKTSSNLSRKYLITSSNSKITADNSSIFKSRTQLNQISKKSLFDNVSNKIGHSSAKFLKHFGLRSNNKSDRKFIIRRPSKNLSTKGYYLTGELPFRNKYILEMDKSHLNISNKRKDMIQCNKRSNTSYNSFCNVSKIKQQEKKIEKLAKKLKIILNSENKKRHETKCDCGNLITFNNGFFNGINIVMDHSPMEGKNENKKTDVYSDGYNFIPTNLPMFLREKFNIKGTTIISPFCMEARDDFLFKRIFYDDKKKDLFKNNEIIDNKLNIIYAENQTQYYQNLTKFNNMLKQNGKKILHEVGPTVTDIKLSKIKNKMSFMKKIVDYAYPNMVLTRVRESEKVLRKKILSEERLPPFKKADELTKKNNIHLGNLLRKSIKIKIINK